MIKLKNILLEDSNSDNQLVQANFKKIMSLTNNIWKSRDVSWGDSLAKSILGNNKLGMFNLAAAIFLLQDKQNPSVEMLSVVVSLILRESKGETAFTQLHPKEIGAWINNYFFGGDSSRGYAQIQPSLAREYGIDPEKVETMTGSVNALYKIMTSRYNLAVKRGYKGDTVTIWNSETKTFIKIPAIGSDAALHAAMASHNGGAGLIQKWCKTNKLGLAAPCNSTNFKNDGRITNNNQPIQNYIPRIQSGGGADTVTYMTQAIKSFNNIKPSILLAFANPLKDIPKDVKRKYPLDTKNIT